MNITLPLPAAVPATITFLRGYLVTMRPYLLFVSGIAGIAGMSFGETTDPVRLLSVLGACFLSYGFGQALTDCFQTDTDAISSPYRPLTRGALSRNLTMAVSLAGLTSCVMILGYWNPANILLGVVAGGGLATYTWFKKRWWGGPWYNAWIVCVLFVMGALAAGYRSGSETGFIMWTAAGTFFAYGNFVLTGYFKDIGADRSTGYHTLPVRFGRRTATLTSDVIAALLGISMFAILAFAGPLRLARFEGAFFFLLAFLTLFAGQWNLHQVRTDDTAHRSIIPVVHTFVLFLSGATALRRPEWFFPLLGFYFTFCFILARRPERQQI
jgi:geranylgeranylglycerol-phosphate geranylgeranyltransferase